MNGNARTKSLAAAVCGLFAFAAGGVHADPAPRFSLKDRNLYAEALAIGRKRAAVILATAAPRTARVAADLQRRGGQIVGRRDDIGYLYVLMPIEQVEFLTGIEGVQKLQLATLPARGSAGLDDGPQIEPLREKRAHGPAPSASTPPDNPYTGESATQALQFKARNPAFDGRGVVGSFVEPAAPNMWTLRSALDAAGNPLPKFAGYDLGSLVEDAAPTADGGNVWQQTAEVKPDAQGRFEWLNENYRLPAGVKASATRWRMCRRIPGGLLTSKERYDILWAVDARRVWVLPSSSGADFDSAPSASLKDAVPWIAIGDDASRRGSRMAPFAFVFAADREKLMLAAAVTHAMHAGMVGSVMAGSGFFGGKIDGIAPAAQLKIYHSGRLRTAPSYAALQVQMAMMSDPKIDLGQASYAAGDTADFGETSPQQIWMDRILRGNGKPFIKAIGNFGAQLYGSDEYSNSNEVFAVGAYTPRRTWLANMGIDTGREHTLASYSGWGPAEDGALKPDFLGMTHTLAEGMNDPWYWEPMPGFEQYGVSGGTSAGAPNGAGHVALLIGAAKQNNLPHDATRLRAAIATTAKFLDGVPARAQGHGLIQVDDAWRALQRAAKWQPVSIEIQAPLVGAEAGPQGPKRTIGRGLFELSGWHPGQQGRREITVMRTSGASEDIAYRLRWKGDVEVFSTTQRTIELPLNQAVKIAVDIQAGDRTASHSAILDVVDPRVDLVVGSILSTVMVSDPLPGNGVALKYQRDAQRIGNTLFFVDVPAGLSAITVQLKKDESAGRWYAQDPTGRRLPFNPYGAETSRSFDPEEFKAARQSFTYLNPVPGVWQFCMNIGEPRSMEKLDAVQDWSKPMPLQVEIRGWSADDDSAPPSLARQQSKSVEFAKAAGESEVQVEAVGVGVTRSTQVKLQPGLKPVFFDVTVDPGATKLEVRLKAGAGARVGLYVYKIPEGVRLQKNLEGTSDDTALAFYDPSFLVDKQYALAVPVAGRYRVALDPIEVPAGGVTVSYRDTVFHPVYGSVELTPAADGASASRAVVTVRARPEQGRRWIAQVGLFEKRNPEAATAIATQSWIVEP